MPNDAAFVTWLNQGIDEGWISPPFCANHDGLPLTVAEKAHDDADEILEHCIHEVRLLASGDVLAWHTRWGNDPATGKL